MSPSGFRRSGKAKLFILTYYPVISISVFNLSMIKWRRLYKTDRSHRLDGPKPQLQIDDNTD